MFRKLSLSAVVLSVGLLAGCAKEHVINYNPNMVLANHLQTNLYSQVNVGQVTLAKGDTNKMSCGIASNRYLPGNLSFSQTIRKALVTQLSAADRYNPGSNNKINIALHDIQYSDSGLWSLAGSVVVNQNKAVEIATQTQFPVSTFSNTCHDAANYFNGAVADFVDQLLSNETILSELNSSQNIQAK